MAWQEGSPDGEGEWRPLTGPTTRRGTPEGEGGRDERGEEGERRGVEPGGRHEGQGERLDLGVQRKALAKLTREGEGAQDLQKPGEGGPPEALGVAAKGLAKVGVGERDLRMTRSGAPGREWRGQSAAVQC